MAPTEGRSLGLNGGGTAAAAVPPKPPLLGPNQIMPSSIYPQFSHTQWDCLNAAISTPVSIEVHCTSQQLYPGAGSSRCILHVLDNSAGHASGPDGGRWWQVQLMHKLDSALTPLSADDWNDFKPAVYNAAVKVIGFQNKRHKDWFDDNDQCATKLLEDMHAKHLSWINDKDNAEKKKVYTRVRNSAQKQLRQMKEDWWATKAEELQKAADCHDLKSFYNGLKTIYGTRDSGTVPVRSQDGNTMITDRAGILTRWAEHFNSALNQTSQFDDTVLSEIPDWYPQIYDEVTRAISQLTSGKAAGADGLPPELFKINCPSLTEKLTKLFRNIWHDRSIPQEFKDATIVHIFKRKGDRSVCDNHRGIDPYSQYLERS